MAAGDEGRRGWKSVREGESLETYVMVSVAIVLLILSIVGISSAPIVSAATLAALGLLGVALLRNRAQGEQLRELLAKGDGDRSVASEFFAETDDVQEVIRTIAESKREVCFWGTTLSMHVPMIAPYLRDAAERGVVVKVLLIKPGSASVEMAGFRSADMPTAAIAHDLERNLGVLSRLGPDRSKLQVKVVDYLAPYTLYAYDPRSSTGRLDIRLGSFKGNHDLRPTFELLRKRDGDWFGYFRDQFDSVWDRAEDAAFPGE